MPGLSIGQKAQRALELLRTLRQTLKAGRRQSRSRAAPGHVLLKELGAWESRWFPIASAALRAGYPDVYAWLFLNVAHSEGASVVIAVGTLLARLETMASEPALGARGAQARELLVKHGLSASALRDARQLLAALGATTAAPPTSLVRSCGPSAGREGKHPVASGDP